MRMTAHDDIKKPRQAKAVYLNGQTINESDIAAKYWQGLFHSVGSQPHLHCFPLEYKWPRSETTVTAAEGLLEAALQFCRKYNVRLHDLIYGVWAIVSARHMTGGQRATVFTVAGRDRSSSRQDREIDLADHDFPLILTVPKDIDVLSWMRHVGDVSAEACSYAHISYKQILATVSVYHPQVKVSINWEHYSEDVVTADAEFPLVLNLSVSAKIRLSVRHNSTVPRMDVRILLDHFAATLHQVLENHHSNISDLQIMPSIERQTL